MISKLLLVIVLVLTQAEGLKRLPLRSVPNHFSSPHPHRILQDSNKTVAFNTNYFTNSQSFAVEVDLGAAYKTAKNILTTTHMFVYISTSETALYDTCARYADYECTTTWCETKETASAFTLPYGQSGTTNRILPILTMVDGDWTLKSHALYFVGATCAFAYPAQSSTSTGSYGWIGMGIDGTAATNFLTSQRFSIYLDSTTNTGEIIFGLDSSKLDICTAATKISSDLNWQMVATSITLGTLQLTGFQYKFIFDLNQNEITLPNSFQQFISFFTTNYQFTCATASFDACTYAGDISTLPNLVFTMQNSAKITLQPQSYLQYVEATQVYRLKMKVVNNGDYFVLGWDIMTNYYILFEQTTTGPQVSLYNHYNLQLAQNNCGITKSTVIPIGYIVGFVLFTVTFLSILLYVIKNAQRKKESKRRYLDAVALSAIELKGMNTTMNPSNNSIGKL